MEPKWLHFTYSLLGLLSNFFEERVPLGQKMKLKKKKKIFGKLFFQGLGKYQWKDWEEDGERALEQGFEWEADTLKEAAHPLGILQKAF